MHVTRGQRRPAGPLKSGLGDDDDPARGGQADFTRLASSGNLFHRHGDRRVVRFETLRSLCERMCVVVGPKGLKAWIIL